MFVFEQNGREKNKNGTKNGRTRAEPINGFYIKARRRTQCCCKVWIALHKNEFLLTC